MTGFTWNLQSQMYMWIRCFSNSTPYFGVYFSNDISISQGQQERNWTWLDLWNFSTINLKSFHNAIDWFGFIFKCLSQYGRGKFSDLHCSNYWKMHSWNFSSTLAWSEHYTPCKTNSPINSPKKVCSPIKSFFKKKVPTLL